MTPIEESIVDSLVGTVTCEGTSAEACYNFPKDFQGFDGHFLNYPILPAILQIMVGRLVCSAVSGVPLRVKSISRAKFLQEISPETNVQVQVTCKEVSTDNVHKFAVALFVNAAKASTFSLFCVAEQGHA
ncbi:hypothetical protein [Halodesulfovibrio sp. MK-HDV]|jgi:3-hydroxyacyl-[acyl-carrier-protein] dehydratase|uniref:hypothetical protein n=1 Tax=Halodesulfovibrio sp. MK-HDV TaxID=2599925 RepID=UPI00136CC75C|nr:hypothetical protein [Halodesulfovibrio sp. MK-HDV]KAF1074915.1 hypothetical protein MKHDV_02467 [Halodesulfovibrio sp. MK-HDV]